MPVEGRLRHAGRLRLENLFPRLLETPDPRLLTEALKDIEKGGVGWPLPEMGEFLGRGYRGYRHVEVVGVVGSMKGGRAVGSLASRRRNARVRRRTC